MPSHATEPELDPPGAQAEPRMVAYHHRCPRMREHIDLLQPLAKPCPSCYSLRVISDVVPYTPSATWQPFA